MKKRIVFFLGVLSVLFLFSCGNNEKSNVSDNSEKKSTLTIAITGNPTTFDPHGKNDGNSMAVRRQIFEGLTMLNTDMSISPCLAESWEEVDPLHLVLKIRKGVKFHDGSDLKASDVEYSIKRAYGGRYASVFMSAFDMENSKAVDEYTYELVLKYPAGTVLQTLAYPVLGITSKMAVEKMAEKDLLTNCPGTGAYKYKDWKASDSVTLEKFPEYWGTSEGCDELVMRIIPETSSRVIEVETGAVDIAYDVSINDINRYNDDPTIKSYRQTTTFLTYIGMVCSKPPFDNPLVRQAVAHCLDRQAFVDMVYGGQGKPASSSVTASVYGYSSNIEMLSYDTELSKELLAMAGYEDGLKTKIWVRDQQIYMDAAEVLRNQLTAGGIDAEIKVVEWASLLVSVENAELDIYIMNLGVPTGDAGDGLFRYFHSSSPFSSNTAFYKSNEFDRLIEDANKESNQEMRLYLLEKAQQFAINDAPWVPLLDNESLFLSNDKVNNLKLHPTTYQFFKDVYVLH